MISNLPKPRARSPMNREGSVVTPIRKHTPSKKQYSNLNVKCYLFNTYSVAGLFNEVNLKQQSAYTLKKMPKTFVETGHGSTDLVIDATVIKFQYASNFELNSLMFSNYKNTQTEKALVGIYPHEGRIFLSDIYPGSISDSKLTEECGAVYFVGNEHEIMSDCVFSIQELCVVIGITLYTPK